MRIAFLGTSEFAVSVLDALAKSSHEIAIVVSTPPRPKGRGRVLENTPVGSRALDLGLPLFQPEKINADESVARLAATRPDLLVVVAYGQILRERVLTMASRGAVNLHGSLLPKYRGAAPIARAIEHGDTRSGVSLQFMVREVDAGDVIASHAMDLDPNENAAEASVRMSHAAAELLLANLDALERGTAQRTPQDATEATFAPQLRKEEGRIDWNRPAKKVHDHVRAMTPWPGAITEWTLDTEVVRLTIHRTETIEMKSASAPGTVLRSSDRLEVATGSDAIRILRLQRAGKREMDASEFLRGTKLVEGTILR
jgi:methionyl-tRNA formyltransferase